MKPTVYIETSIVSYLTSRPAADLIARGHQETTRVWWERRRADFRLVTSQFVLDEASAGDQAAARGRLAALASIDLLTLRPAISTFADFLISNNVLPRKARFDALHLAACAVEGVQFLLTWNCSHLANASRWKAIRDACGTAGYVPPVICTPYELLGEADVVRPDC